VKILLDECVPWPLAKLLDGHVCSNPYKQGWSSLKNGELLRLAEVEFDIFVTSDQNLRYQQNLSGRRIAILELSTNDWHAIHADVENIRITVNTIKSGDFIHYSVDGM
jgi:hypothetical protein